MNTSARLGTYLSIVRKHLLLLTISMVVVATAGGLYLSRQEPLFEAHAILDIHVPYSDPLARDVENFLSLNPRELQTQMTLLKEKQSLAQKVVTTLGERGVDVAAAGYTEASLRANVRVAFIPGTQAVKFSLKGRDAATLPAAVRAYVDVYKADSEGKSGEAYRITHQTRQAEFDTSKKLLEEAEDRRSSFKLAHPGVNFEMNENPDREQWKKLADQLPGLERTARRNRQELRAVLATVKSAGITASDAETGYGLTVAGGASLVDRLAADGEIAGLDVVVQHSGIAVHLIAEREVARRKEQLVLGGVRAGEGHAKLDADLERHRIDRGKLVQRVVERELTRLTTELASFEIDKDRAADLKAKGETVLRQQLEFDALVQKVEQAKRHYEDSQEELKRIGGKYFGGDDEVKGPTRTIEIVRVDETAGQIAPNKPVIIGLTAFAAMAVAFGLVLLVEYLDDTIKSRDDFDRYVGLPMLGYIPHISDKEAQNPDLAANAKPGSAVAEAFRAVRTAILFSRSDHPVRSILITSAGPGEGKTTVATNLAATLAKHKAPVLVMDADLRRPRVAKALGLPNERGLTNYLIGEARLEDVVQETAVEGLHALTSGPIPPNPAELLHGDRMTQVLKDALAKYDRVVIDSPPLIAVTDAQVLASQVDGLYVVISMGKTSRRLIQRAVESIVTIGFEVHGTILNNLDAPTGRYGYYYYRDYAYSKDYYRDS